MNYSPFTCLDPQLIRNRFTKEWVTVPCGKCEACLTLKSQRLMSKIDDESKQHYFVYFITLSFSNDFIPFIDVSTIDLESQPWYNLYLESDAYRAVYGDKIYHLSVEMCQNFFKRLRKNIYNLFTDYGKSTNKIQIPRIRYYLCGEYGCTTFRPHMHLLLYFDNERLACNIERLVSESWRINLGTPTSPDYRSIGNVKCEPVSSSASSYVSSYCTSLSMLPPILQYSDFSPFHIASSRPALGLYRPQYDFRKIAFEDTKISFLKVNRKYETFLSEFPCSFISRYFPRCTNFYSLSVSQLVRLYSFTYYFCYLPNEKTSDFVNRIISYIDDSRPKYLGSYECILNSIELYLSRCFADRFESLQKLTYLSRHFVSNFYELKRFKSFHAYVRFIVNFWRRRDYSKLVAQLKFEEDWCNKPFHSSKSRGFHLMIDSNFFRRNLSDEALGYYSEQFDLSVTDFRDLSEYRKFSDDSIAKYFSHIKAKLDRDYLLKHPEFSAFHPVDLL